MYASKEYTEDISSNGNTYKYKKTKFAESQYIFGLHVCVALVDILLEEHHVGDKVLTIRARTLNARSGNCNPSWISVVKDFLQRGSSFQGMLRMRR